MRADGEKIAATLANLQLIHKAGNRAQSPAVTQIIWWGHFAGVLFRRGTRFWFDRTHKIGRPVEP